MFSCPTSHNDEELWISLKSGRGSPAVGVHKQTPNVAARDAAAVYREQVGRAVERTLLHRSGRRYPRRPSSSSFEAWAPCQASSAQTPTGLPWRRPPVPGKSCNSSSTKAELSPFPLTITHADHVPRPPRRPASADAPTRSGGGDDSRLGHFHLSEGAVVLLPLSDQDGKHARRQRLRRFVSRRRCVRDDVVVGADGGSRGPAASPSNNTSPPQPPLPLRPYPESTGTRQMSEDLRPTSTRAETPQVPPPHPWRTLMHLGSSNFNDAPLHTFISVLSLHCEALRGRAPAHTSAAMNLIQPCAVHVADVEVTRFRVELPSSLHTSPILPLLKALDGEGGTADARHAGSVFYITPLLDDDDVDGDAVGEGSMSALASSGLHANSARAINSFLDRLMSSPPLQLPTQYGVKAVGAASAPVDEAACASNRSGPSSGLPSRRGSTCIGDDNAKGTSVAADELEAAMGDCTLDSTLAAMRSLAATAMGVSHRQNVDSWRRYCTAVALYLCLAQAGVCDAASLPFLSVQLLPFQQVLSRCDIRVELMMGSRHHRHHRARARRLLKLARSQELVPVAVTLPTARKGVLRALPKVKGAAPSIATQPFTDAEIFQLFYLQLIFRAFYDVRFPDMTWPVATSAPGGGGGASGCLRSDKIGSAYSARAGLAFEHPTKADSWLLFPPRSRILTLLDLDHAVIPMYATATDLQRSANMPLFGSTPDVPCQTSFGSEVVGWGAAQQVNGPRAAFEALGELFALFSPRYGCARASVWQSAVPPKVFRCNERVSFEAMRRHCGTLSRFFVPAESRASDHDTLRRRQPLAVASSSSSRQLSRRPSAFRDIAKPTLPSLWPTDDAHSVGSSVRYGGGDQPVSVGGGGEEREGGSVRVTAHHDAAPLGASFSVLEELAHDPATSFAAHTSSSIRSAQQPCQHPSVSSSPADGRDLTTFDATVRETSTMDEGKDVDDDALLAMTIGATSPFTKQESLVTRWRYYTTEGNISIFDGVTTGIELHGFLGRGGSGLVYRGRYGKRGLPVAVKVFIIPDGMQHEDYVRESLTDVAFFVLMNQLDDFAICSTCRAHDFIVSAVPPRGLPEEDANTARRNRDATATQLCYLVTDLMDDTLGRFLAEDEDDYDPCYDTLVNSPLRAGELFHFLYVQLAVKAMFDWKILDLMLNGQLRGDNVGFRYVDLTLAKRREFEANPGALSEALLARNYYKGVMVAFQNSATDPMRYLRFTSDLEEGDPHLGPLRFIYFIDLGQGIQPNVTELTGRKYIGETVVDSCVEDDGFGRYWPLHELYCRYVEVHGPLTRDVVEWGSQVSIHSQDDAVQAMRQLLEMYYPVYGVPAPTQEELSSYMLFTWSPSVVGELKKSYVYRTDPHVS